MSDGTQNGAAKLGTMPMAQRPNQFDDGEAYERFMGVWSQLAGQVFLDWLSPATGQRWIDVGCGNGAFTEQLIRRCAPAEAQGIDPSEAQITFARTRPGARSAIFRLGDAMALPFAADSFDAAVMALVIFFVPDPARGLAEMRRVVRPGGMVVAYAWDALGGAKSARADSGRNACPGPHAPASAERQRLTHGGTARPLVRCGTGGGRDFAKSLCNEPSPTLMISGKRPQLRGA